MKNFLNFDLEISRSTVHVINSPDGECQNKFDFPFSDSVLKKYIKDFTNTRSIVSEKSHTITPHDLATKVEKFGRLLFESIFHDDVGNLYRESIKTAKNKKMGLRIRLRVTNFPELVRIPWEFLYDNRTNSFLCLSNDISIVRYIELISPTKRLSVASTLNILVIISDPSDYPILNSQLEKLNLEKALKKPINLGIIKLDFLNEPTIPKLVKKLHSFEYHIIHFIGHGIYDIKSQEGSLIFKGNNNKGAYVSGKRLATVIEKEQSLKLIILNACEGGLTSSTNVFSGVAQSLVKKGIPAVLAMQFTITDKAAIIFSEAFYSALAEGKEIDRSLSQARQGIYNIPNEFEFGTAALYMRTKSGSIFGKRVLKNKKKKQSSVNSHLLPRLIIISFIFALSIIVAYGIYLIAFEVTIGESA